jgi:hypothetical protein
VTCSRFSAILRKRGERRHRVRCPIAYYEPLANTDPLVHSGGPELAANGRSERENNAVHENELVVTPEIDGDVTPAMAAHVAGRVRNHVPSQRHLRHDEIGTRPRHSDFAGWRGC